MNIKSLMMGHSLRKRILSTLTGILLTFVLILTNFAGLNPVKVHAATYTHTVTFDANANGVIGTMPAQSVYEGINTQLNANEFSRSGYSFTGWNTNANGGGTGYSNQGSVNLTGDLTLYAQWTQAQTISRTVTFKVVNGSWDDGTTADKTVTYSRYDNEDLVLTLQAGDIPAVGNAPDSGYTAGSWDQIPNTDVSLSADVTYTYTYGGSGPAQAPVSNPTPVPQAATVSTVVTDSVYVSDPLALDGVTIRGGIPYEFKKQVQGPLCIAAFNAQKPAGWNEAFTFNMKRFGYIEDYSFKEGMLTYTVPKEYQKAGREYAIMGIDKNGKVKVFQPIAYAAPYIFFVPIDIEGYAFALIYKD